MSIQTQVKRAARSVKTALATKDQPREDTDILDTLKKEHDEVKALLSKLRDAEGAAERRSLVKQIKAALVPHTKAEEKVVYDAVIALKDKDAQTDGHEGYLEHEWASKTLDRLEKTEPATSPAHKAAAKVLKELVEHHIKEEENNVWDDVEKNFSEDDRIAMNRKFLVAKTKVKLS
jgi:hemerythrin superfamily protein